MLISGWFELNNIITMSVILKNTQPPLLVVSKLGGKEAQVYCFIWQSAVMDVRYDKDPAKQWEDRRDCGGTTHWSVKGIAAELGTTRKTVSKAIRTLLDNGLITIAGYINNRNGSDHTVFRVVHPDQIESVRATLGLLAPASERWTARMTSKKKELVSSDCSELFDDIPVPEHDEFNAYYPERDSKGKIKVLAYPNYEQSLEHEIDLAVEGFY